jgi:hypothetical protein
MVAGAVGQETGVVFGGDRVTVWEDGKVLDMEVVMMHNISAPCS